MWEELKELLNLKSIVILGLFLFVAILSHVLGLWYVATRPAYLIPKAEWHCWQYKRGDMNEALPQIPSNCVIWSRLDGIKLKGNQN